jgi:hypothetical protein
VQALPEAKEDDNAPPRQRSGHWVH